jgi:hypothetical protein
MAGGRAPRSSRKVLPLSGTRVTSLLGGLRGHMVTRLVTEVLSASTRCQSVSSETSGLAPRRFDPCPLSHRIIPIAAFLH